jgi:tRNA(Arg) A34 adenosine deaminase TadA
MASGGPGLEVRVANPEWVQGALAPGMSYPTDEDKVRLAIGLAAENVQRETGGPFGAAVFEGDGGGLVAAGVNSVLRLRSAVLHAEMVALLLASARTGAHSLRMRGDGRFQLAASCEPCAMCLGAILWGGVGRLICGASRQDATALGFDEGPVTEDSYRYLSDRGVTIVRGVLAREAQVPFTLYRDRGGPIYNG